MIVLFLLFCFFFFKQKTAYEMRISDWSSDVCSSDLGERGVDLEAALRAQRRLAGSQLVAERVAHRVADGLIRADRRQPGVALQVEAADPALELELVAGAEQPPTVEGVPPRGPAGVVGLPPPAGVGRQHRAVVASPGNQEVSTAEVDRREALPVRSEEHTSELQSLMRTSYAVFCLTKKITNKKK